MGKPKPEAAVSATCSRCEGLEYADSAGYLAAHLLLRCLPLVKEERTQVKGAKRQMPPPDHDRDPRRELSDGIARIVRRARRNPISRIAGLPTRVPRSRARRRLRPRNLSVPSFSAFGDDESDDDDDLLGQLVRPKETGRVRAPGKAVRR